MRTRGALALRSQALGYSLTMVAAARWATFLEPPLRRASALAPVLGPSPPTIVFIYFRWLSPAWTEALVVTPVVEDQNGKARQLRRAWLKESVLTTDSNPHDLGAPAL
eukprot:6214554-Pleurochrysis_carterae.AAC.3